jgi:anti-sigma factor RsiW
MQHCDDICTQIAIGELADPDVQTHLAHCVACSDYAAQMTALDQQLSKLPRPVPSDTLTLQLMAIAADHAMPTPRRRQPWWGSLVVFAIGVVALGFSVLISAEIVVLFATLIALAPLVRVTLFNAQTKANAARMALVDFPN